MNLWILTEERPKKNVVEMIVRRFGQDRGHEVNTDHVRIIPKIVDNRFSFLYKVQGISVETIAKIFLKIVSGQSSFVDFLVFMQENEPDESSVPLYAIEETKTSDAESRNTGVYQRSSKFVFIDFYYPTARKIMLYNIQRDNYSSPTETNIFGTRMLMTIGVEVMGKHLDNRVFRPFESIDELIAFKARMRDAPAGNVPILFTRRDNRIEVSGRLIKSGSLSHDPNIGALTIIGKTLRALGWPGEIVVTRHGLSQHHLTERNKFVRIANKLDMSLDGLNLPRSNLPRRYWEYDTSSEKMVTIFLHLILDEVPGVEVIYENHAGCERGYFKKRSGDCVAIHKYIQDVKSKGDLRIPDSIVRDDNRRQILILEGKTVNNMAVGITELADYNDVENEYIRPNYLGYRVDRFVVLFGGLRVVNDSHVAFVLTSNGDMMTTDYTPAAIIDAVENAIATNNVCTD